MNTLLMFKEMGRKGAYIGLTLAIYMVISVFFQYLIAGVALFALPYANVPHWVVVIISAPFAIWGIWKYDKWKESQWSSKSRTSR